MIDLQERFLERKSFIYRLFLVYLMFGLLLIIIWGKVLALGNFLKNSSLVKSLSNINICGLCLAKRILALSQNTQLFLE